MIQTSRRQVLWPNLTAIGSGVLQINSGSQSKRAVLQLVCLHKAKLYGCSGVREAHKSKKRQHGESGSTMSQGAQRVREHGEAGSAFAILMQALSIFSSPAGAPPHSLLQPASFIRIAANQMKELGWVPSSRPPRSGNAVGPLCKG